MLQILLSENPESNILPCESRRAIIQRACACYDREVERERKDKQQEQPTELLHETESARSVALKPDLVQQYRSQLTVLVKNSLLIFSQSGDRGESPVPTELRSNW